MNKYYPSAGPSITETEIQLVLDAVTNGWYENRNYHTELCNFAISQMILSRNPESNCS